MRNFVIRHKLLSMFLLLVTLVCMDMAWDGTAAVRGRLVARFDLGYEPTPIGR
jgi:hypothetical protein